MRYFETHVICPFHFVYWYMKCVIRLEIVCRWKDNEEMKAKEALHWLHVNCSQRLIYCSCLGVVPFRHTRIHESFDTHEAVANLFNIRQLKKCYKVYHKPVVLPMKNTKKRKRKNQTKKRKKKAQSSWEQTVTEKHVIVYLDAWEVYYQDQNDWVNWKLLQCNLNLVDTSHKRSTWRQHSGRMNQ